MASMLEEMRRMAGLEPRWPEYTLGEDKLTPLEQHILKKLKTKPTSADDLAWDAPGEALPKDIDKALARLKKLGKVQAVKQPSEDEDWVWKLLEWDEDEARDRAGARRDAADPEDRPPSEEWLEALQDVYLHERDHGKVEAVWWYGHDHEASRHRHHQPEERHTYDSLDKALDALDLTPAEKKKAHEAWEMYVVKLREEMIAVFYNWKTGKVKDIAL